MVLSLIFYALVIGPRPHLAELLPAPRILFKIVFPIAVFACAGPLALQLARPRGDPRPLVYVLIGLLLGVGGGGGDRASRAAAGSLAGAAHRP